MSINPLLDVGCRESGQLWTRKAVPRKEDG